MRFLKNNSIALLILLIFSLIIYHQWIGFSWFSEGDYPLNTSQSLVSFIPQLSWDSRYSFGGQNIVFWRYPHMFLHGLFGLLGYGSNVSEKFLVFGPAVLGGVLVMYLIGLELSLGVIGAAIASIVFNFNTYFFSITDHIYITCSEVAGLFSLLFFIRYFKLMESRYLIFSLLALSVSSFYDLRGAVLSIGLIFLYAIFESYLLRWRSIKYIKGFLTLCIFFVFVSSFWVLPQIVGKSFSSNEILSRNLFGNEFLALPQVITIHHPFWTGGKLAWFHTQPIPWFYWIIPITMILAAYYGRKNKYVIFAGLVAMFGLFLGKQVASPFGEVYIYLFDHLPGFSAFREASKFFFFVIFGFSILYGSVWISSTLLRNTLRFLVRLVLGIAIFVSVGLSSFAFMQGRIGKLDSTIKYQSMDNLLKSQILQLPPEGRILSIPRNDIWVEQSASHTVIPFTNAIDTIWKSQKKPPDDTANQYRIQFKNLFATESSFNRLCEGSIGMIVFQEQSEPYLLYKLDKADMIQSLDRLPYLERLPSNGASVAYKVISPCPKIAVRTDTGKGMHLSAVNFGYINSGEYRVLLPSTASGTLFFSEAYHPSWILLMKNLTLADRLFPWNIRGLSPHKSIYGFQEYNIPDIQSCKNKKLGCLVAGNDEKRESILIFLPQLYILHGTAVSILSLVAFVGWHMYFRRSVKKEINHDS